LHVTLTANFVVNRKGVGWFEQLAELAVNQKPVITTASDDDYFGPQEQVHVTTLVMTAGIKLARLQTRYSIN
jgi:hypothetical protein